MACRIIIADDHPLFREAMVGTVQRLLPDALIEQAGDFDSVLAKVARGAEPDTLLLDLRFPGLTCITQLVDLRQQL
ncbi:DNA-binding response regulator, partial [Pseudomonas frederiksbergensis]|nr:DNA-binding response regulator [Pseudomonas frederiksbergensis]